MEKERQLVELIGDQIPSSVALPRSKRRRSKEEVRRGATARGVMEKSWGVGIIERRKVRENDPIEYLLSTEVRSIF